MWVLFLILIQIVDFIAGFSLGLFYMTSSNPGNDIEGIQTNPAIITQNETEIIININAVILNKHDYYSSSKKAVEMINMHDFDVLVLFDHDCETDVVKSILSNRYNIHCYRPLVVQSADQTVCRIKYPHTKYGLENTVSQHNEAVIMWSILKHFESFPTILVHDNTTEAPVTELAHAVFTRGIQILLLNVDTISDVLWFLEKTYSTLEDKQRNYLIFCSTSCTNKILNLANEFDQFMNRKTALRQLSKWLIVDYDDDLKMMDFKEIQLDNVALVQSKHHQDSTTANRIVQNVLREIKDIIQSTETILSTEEWDLEIKGSFVQELINGTGCILADIHSLLWKTEGRQFNLVGQTGGNLIVSKANKLFPNIDYGFNNRTFRVLVKEWFPFIIQSYHKNTKHFTGLSIDLLNEISISMNFSYVLVEPEDGKWGHQVNGSWTGIIKELSENKADLSVSPLAITSQRASVVDFSFPFYFDYTGVGYKLPDPNLSKWKKLLAPFKWQVFLCIIISYMLLLLLLYTIERQNPYYKTNQAPKFGDMALYLYGALLAQGCSNPPKSASGRCIVAFWWLFSIILVATYSGNLIAFLTVTKDQHPFSSLVELGQQNEYKWGTVGSTVWENFLQMSNRSELQQIWTGIKEFNKTDPDVLNYDINVHFDKIGKGSYALIADKISLNFQLNIKCDWVVLKESFLPMNYAITLPKDSPFDKRLFDEMMRLIEIGLLQTWERKWLTSKDMCGDSQAPQVKAIELLDIQTAFYIISIGIVIGLSCLAGEWLTTCSSQRQKLP